MDRHADIIELSAADLEHVTGGSLLGTMLKPSMKILAKIRVQNAIDTINDASQKIQDALDGIK